MKKIRQKLPAALLMLLAILFIPGMANAKTKEYQGERWNFKTVKQTSGAFTYYTYPSKNQKEAWLFRIDIKEGGKIPGRLSIPSKIGNKKVTRLGAPDWHDWRTYNIFGISAEYVYSEDSYTRWGKLIKNLVIPDTVKIIQAGTFYGMDSITTVKLPKSLERLGGLAFYHCDKLREAELPAKLKSFDPLAFEECPSLAKIKLSSKNKTYRIKDNCLITKKKKELVFALPTEGKVRIPKGVKTLKEYSFCNCAAEEVLIPASVTEIEAGAFKTFCGRTLEIENLTVDGKNAAYGKDGQCVYKKKDKSLVIMIRDKTGTVYVTDKVERLTERVMLVGARTENKEPELSKIVFPKTFKTVVDQGLNWIHAEKIYFTSEKPPKMVLKKKKKIYRPVYPVYVPESSEEAYRTWYTSLKKRGGGMGHSFNTFKPGDEI